MALDASCGGDRHSMTVELDLETAVNLPPAAL
jgi:hypothetical protein